MLKCHLNLHKRNFGTRVMYIAITHSTINQSMYFVWTFQLNSVTESLLHKLSRYDQGSILSSVYSALKVSILYRICIKSAIDNKIRLLELIHSEFIFKYQSTFTFVSLQIHRVMSSSFYLFLVEPWGWTL